MNSYDDLTDEQKVKELKARDREIMFLNDQIDRRFPSEIDSLKDEIDRLKDELKGIYEENDSNIGKLIALNSEAMQIRTLLKYSTLQKIEKLCMNVLPVEITSGHAKYKIAREVLKIIWNDKTIKGDTNE